MPNTQNSRESWNAPQHMQEWHQPTYQRGYRGNHWTAPRRYNSQNGFTRGSKSYRGYNNSDFRSANREYASASSIMMSHSGVTKSARLHIHPGSINSVPCSVLQDTRCSIVGIKSSFINPEDFTGETATCVMFDGTECTLPTAHAHIETPFFKGNVVALFLSSPVADRILGNIVGVNDPTWRENNGGRYERELEDTRECNVTNAMTRAQKTAEGRVHNQDSPVNKSKQNSDSVINFDAIGKLDKHTFRIEKESDQSLDPLRSNESYYIKEGSFRGTPRKITVPISW